MAKGVKTCGEPPAPRRIGSRAVACFACLALWVFLLSPKERREVLQEAEERV